MVRISHFVEVIRVLSVFQKFGGIRPMAAKLGEPPSTIKSWHAKGKIPAWRHDAVLAAAKRHGIALARDELVNVRPDTDLPANDTAASQEAA
jgi:hypothetical protein